MGLLAANGIILGFSSEAVTPVEKINALPKVQRHPVIHVSYVIVFLGSECLWGCVLGAPNKNVIKRASQALNDLSS